MAWASKIQEFNGHFLWDPRKHMSSSRIHLCNFKGRHSIFTRSNHACLNSADMWHINLQFWFVQVMLDFYFTLALSWWIHLTQIVSWAVTKGDLLCGCDPKHSMIQHTNTPVPMGYLLTNFWNQNMSCLQSQCVVTISAVGWNLQMKLLS